MARPGGDRGGTTGRDLDFTQQIRELARNPWMVILMAAVTGTSTGTLFGRPDPFTGAQGAALLKRIQVLEAKQALDDDHRRVSESGYRRMRENEHCCAVLRVQLARQIKEIDILRLRVEKTNAE